MENMSRDKVNVLWTCVINIPWIAWLYFSSKFLYNIAQGENLILAIAGAYIAGGITLYIFFYTFEAINMLRGLGYKIAGKKSKPRSRRA